MALDTLVVTVLICSFQSRILTTSSSLPRILRCNFSAASLSARYFGLVAINIDCVLATFSESLLPFNHDSKCSRSGPIF